MTTEFAQYRGDGTTRDGKAVQTPSEHGAYLAGKDLATAVNTMLAVEQPLLITGDAGTGKTVLAFSIAAELELGEVEMFAVRSDHQGRDLLYEFDNLQRFYDTTMGDKKAAERKHYLKLGALGKAIVSGERRVVLIDEVDKAPRDFPNDLLDILDHMDLRIPELDMYVRAKHRPIVVITSNRESQLPDPFLRRCVFHHIEFPDRAMLLRILDQRLGYLKLDGKLRQSIVDRFLEIRKMEGLQKLPATSEMLTWTRAIDRAQVSVETLERDLPNLPFLGALLKTREDIERFKRSARAEAAART